MEEGFEPVYQAATALDANIARALLEDAGITVVVLPAGEAWKRIYFGEMHAKFGVLLVPADDAEQAKALLAEYQRQMDAGAFALQDDEAAE